MPSQDSSDASQRKLLAVEAQHAQTPMRAPAQTFLETALEHLQVALRQADADVQFDSLPHGLCHPTALVRIFQNLTFPAETAGGPFTKKTDRSLECQSC